MSVQISDPVHSTIALPPLCAELLDAPEVQRLSGIRQLGLAYLVFPGANHTRLEHSLGTCHLAGRLADAAGLEPSEKDLVTAAALLHDIGHIPFSHTFESVLKSRLGMDHMERTKRIIVGREGVGGEPAIPGLLEEHGLAPSKVASLVTGSGRSRSRRVVADIIHGTVDADQLDFLIRDAHYTGVAHGVLDLPRLISSVRVHRGGVAVSAKGVPAVEGMLVARGLMYSSVYYHKTIRIASMMLSRAADRALSRHPADEGLLDMSDGQFLEWLRAHGEEETVRALSFRRLRKMAWGVRSQELDDGGRRALRGLLRDIPGLESRIARRSGCEPGEVIVDVPERSLLLSEPRIHRTDLAVIDDDGRASPFPLHSPLASAMEIRTVSPWAVIVSSGRERRDAVAKAAARELSRLVR